MHITIFLYRLLVYKVSLHFMPPLLSHLLPKHKLPLIMSLSSLQCFAVIDYLSYLLPVLKSLLLYNLLQTTYILSLSGNRLVKDRRDL